jgi:protease-4
MHQEPPPAMPPPPPPPASPPPPAAAPRPPARERSNAPLWITLALLTGMFAGGTCATCATLGGPIGGEEIILAGGERVGVIELLGPIADAEEVVKNIRKFAMRDDLIALVVRIDSPGGAVAPSQEIYRAMRWASEKKPVVASMGNVAASGGFWASLGADWVFASPGTITGSIGVITQLPDLRGIAEFLRFRMRTFTSGPLKDAGNPFREMTPEDEALFRSLIDDIYDQFITLTAERRNLSLEQVKIVADGRVMTGRAAKEAGLVDELGGLHEAARKAMVMAKMRNAVEEGETVTSTAAYDELEDPTLVYPKKDEPSLLQLLTEGIRSGVARGVSQAIDRVAEEDAAPVELR